MSGDSAVCCGTAALTLHHCLPLEPEPLKTLGAMLNSGRYVMDAGFARGGSTARPLPIRSGIGEARGG